MEVQLKDAVVLENGDMIYMLSCASHMHSWTLPKLQAAFRLK
jgi:hypothetical protein